MPKSDLQNIHKRLLDEWRNNNQQQTRKCLQDLEKALFDPSNKEFMQQNPTAMLTIQKDYFEINALYFVKESNLDRFGQAIQEVLSFYDVQQNSIGVKSEQQYLMYGLHLMHLLATNKIAKFHMFIEKLDYVKRKTDPFIDVPVKLERYLMEGAYNLMNLAESSLPSPYYKPFMSKLKQSVQNDIAVSLEKCYRSIPVKTVMKKLFLKDEAEAIAFGNQRGWIRKGQEFLIAGNDAEMEKKQPILALASGAERVLQPIDTQDIMRQCLHYASHLERIV